jgi:malonyl-CoA O-methyltransferase
MDVRGGYDRWAAVYDHDANPLQALEGPVVREAVSNPRGLTALDLGCGTGRHALWLASAGADVTAVDFSDGMLAQADSSRGRRRSSLSSTTCTGRSHSPTRRSTSWSAVWSWNTCKSWTVLPRARRVLRPGNRAVVSAMHPAMFLQGAGPASLT